jgi:ATP-dependent DNA ligase
VGITASFTRQQREELVDQLGPHRLPEAAAHPWLRRDGDDAATRRPGTANRWSGTRDLSFEPLAPELVCEVAYDHLQGDRFRHPTTFRRWRPDRDPQSCTYDQLDVAVPAELAAIFAGKTQSLTDTGPRRGPS